MKKILEKVKAVTMIVVYGVIIWYNIYYMKGEETK